MVKAVIFDMDGVLLDTEKHYCTMWRRAAHELGFLDFTMEHSYRLRSLAAKYAEPMLKEQFGEAFDYYAVRERRRELVDQALEEQGVEGKPGAEELLRECEKFAESADAVRNAQLNAKKLKILFCF